MKTNRRKFFQVAGVAGTGLMAGGLSSYKNTGTNNSSLASVKIAAETKHSRQFNMCGYVAPKLETVRIGIIGLGVRGTMAVEWSVANRSNSIDVPDFTDGAWKTNVPVDINRIGVG